MMVYSELMLRKQLFEFYENKLIDDFGLSPESIAEYDKEISPIVYLSILNKKVASGAKKVITSPDFHVPDEYVENWNQLRSAIETGEDISQYMGRGTNDWLKADFLLFSCNIFHLHLTSRKGKSSNKELVFGVFTDDKFYALYFGDHNDVFSAKKFVDLAQKHWPNEILSFADEQGSDTYNPRLALDPKSHFNLVKPAGSLNGHQHTVLTTMTNGSDQVRNVPLHLLIQYNNEVKYLNSIEDKLAGRIKADVEVSLTIDLVRQEYRIKAKGHYVPYVYPFSKMVTCSKTLAEKYL
ncbi:hypothetical protein [Vibrio lentus]|uniref:hypothetical protein n=1 Tax=Vibrio lentus TaxID=136468 RepID=UPI00097815C0|nr:hypothetical protein [Vibrio lentus]OMO22527.1 hypothetical protein BH583_24210 [Vibrio lentus]PMN12387.1 hypothetical protein BCT38_24010 [Vibrio lentus]